MNRVRRVISTIFLFIGIFAAIIDQPLSAQAADNQKHQQPTSQEVQKQLKQVLKANNANAIILVNGKKQNQPIVISNQIKEGKKRAAPINPHRLFPIASFQKNITGLAIFQLSQKHKLSVNDPLAKYYPQIKEAKKVSLQNLITHTSGYGDTSAVTKSTLHSQRQLAQFTKKHYTMAGKIGNWNYANANYGFLAMVVAKASHESYHRYLRSHIFRPYHLKTACFANQAVNHQNITPSLKMAYVYDQKAKGHPWSYLSRQMDASFGAGDMYCSPLDYWRFVNQAILNNGALLQTYQSNLKQVANSIYYGGFYWKDNQIHSNSSYDGYSATIYSDFASKRTMICFSNNLDHDTMTKVAKQLHDIYFQNESDFDY